MNQALRLSEFARLLADGIQRQFGDRDWWVIAEVSNLKIYHDRRQLYFHLVEKDAETRSISAEVSCVGFQEAYAQTLHFKEQTGRELDNGMEVLMRVSVSFHAVRGLKLLMRGLDSNFTLGQMQQQRQRTIERLLAENPDAVRWNGERLITRNHQLQLPAVIQRIAVISSEQSAGLQDFLHTLRDNEFGYQFQVQIFGVRVQGEQHASSLVEKLVEIFNRSTAFDAVVMVRGGGAQTDFLLYDAYPLVKAVARFPLPVITGIGHLKDVSLTDSVAHAPVKTPTKAAEFILAHNRRFEELLSAFMQQILLQVQQKIRTHTRWLTQLSLEVRSESSSRLRETQRTTAQLRENFSTVVRQSLQKASAQVQIQQLRLQTLPQSKLELQQRLLVPLAEQLPSSAIQLMMRRKEALRQMENLMTLLGPDSILKRGFVMVEQQGKMITSLEALENGQAALIFAGGTATIEVLDKTIKYGQEGAKRKK
jgi:exodeoxyribonuclease VII large subunit